MSNRGHALSREEMVRTLTAYSGTTTSAGAADGSSLIDSELIDKNDFLTGKSILILSGVAQWETAGISSFNSATGELSLSPALNSRIVAGVAFRVLNTLPESLHITSGIVQIQGYDYVSGEYRLVAVNVSGQIEIKATVADIVTAKISGQTVRVSGQAVRVSGQTVIAKISGETVVAETSISGNVVKISGETVIAKISGETVIAKVSGETIIAKISGETVVAEVDLSGKMVVVSGEVIAKISGETVVAEISGQTVVAEVSGQTVVAEVDLSGKMVVVSGEVIAKISGETVVAEVDLSGKMVVVSGEVIAKISGETVVAEVDLSGKMVVVSGEVIAKISGETVVTSVSGNVVKISGETVVAEIDLSGKMVVVSGEVIAKISGETVVAEVSGQAVRISGAVMQIILPTEFKTGLIRSIKSASGGEVLHSGAVKAAQIKADKDNSGAIIIGGATNRPWYEARCSGLGFVLDPGEAKSEDIDNFNRIYVVAQVSGDQISFGGVN